MLVAPTRAVEAAAVVAAATPSVLPVLAAVASPVVVADGGRLRGGLSPLVLHADVVVVAHRQHAGSAAAAALGFERLAELTSQLSVRSIPTVVALVGDRPYGADEVAVFVEADAVMTIADDPWSAAVFAGRAGSAIRLRRSPLMRSLGELAAVISANLRQLRSYDGLGVERNVGAVDRERRPGHGPRAHRSLVQPPCRRDRGRHDVRRPLVASRRRKVSVASVCARTGRASSC